MPFGASCMLQRAHLLHGRRPCVLCCSSLCSRLCRRDAKTAPLCPLDPVLVKALRALAPTKLLQVAFLCFYLLLLSLLLPQDLALLRWSDSFRR